MNLNPSFIIDKFLTTYLDVFTVDYFYRYIRSKGERITRSQAHDILNSSDFVFSLVGEEYITRAGVFTGRWFSFKPSKEEIKKRHIILGHRCMPFVNPNIAPDQICVCTPRKMVFPDETVFSMNLAMDVFALFGEGYVIPYLFNDAANKTKSIASLQYTNMPTEISLTSWPLDEIIEKKDFKYGDRLLCRVVDWANNEVEIIVQKNESKSEISKADIQREEWYSDFENGILASLKKNGPASSIEEQLAFLFLENERELCIENCGSSEEFLKHTKKIGFAPYGVESRIWQTGQSIPYIGPWNNEVSTEVLFSNISLVFAPQIIDCYLKNYIYESRRKHIKKTIDELINDIFPVSLKMSTTERKLLLLNIEKRHDIMKKEYNQFAEHENEPVRNRVITLFSQVSSLLCSIGCSGLKLEMFPQQELIILTQLFNHIERIIEELENVYLRDQLPLDDIQLSLEGMEDTFDEIFDTLNNSLEVNTYKSIKIVE